MFVQCAHTQSVIWAMSGFSHQAQNTSLKWNKKLIDLKKNSSRDKGPTKAKKKKKKIVIYTNNIS